MHQLKGLYVILSRPWVNEANIITKTKDCILGGASLIQYRNKSSDHLQVQKEAKLIQNLCQQAHIPFIINDDYDLAKSIGADGVHLGQADLDQCHVFNDKPSDFIVGVTCHDSLKLALKAEQMGASYVAFGRFFKSTTKPHASPAKLGILLEAKRQLKVPTCAIGGINIDTMSQLSRYQPDMYAVIEAALGSNTTVQDVIALAHAADH